MFNALTKQKEEFTFNGKKFEIYNKDLIEEFLGKTGNQTAINGAGSNWKKEIRRYKTSKQDESKSLNPKYSELKKLIENYIKINDELLKEGDESIRKLLSENLLKFKKDFEFRKECLGEILNSEFRFKKNIPMEYFYIVFSIYIALNYNYFTINKENKFSPLNFEGQEEFIKAYFDILNKEDFQINNLNCFSYTQYFWMDYRLSESLHSELHKIIYDIFEELSKVSKIEEKESSPDLIQSKFETKEVMLRSLLSEEVQFKVPDYQREYSWESNKEVRAFLKDFLDVYKKKIKKYFLGSVVLIEDGKDLQVVDGQQRLTTIIIMLSILRELYSKQEFKTTLDKYLNFDFKENGVLIKKHKLELNKNNLEFFRRYITCRLAENERGEDWKYNEKDCNEFIFKAYKEIKRTILDEIGEVNDETIEKIEGALLDSFHLVNITVPNEQMANKIFETLNDRGRILKTHENIKNHIFGRVNFEFEVLRDKWNGLLRLYGSKHFENYMIQVYKSNFIENYKNLTKNSFFSHFKSNTEIKDYHKFVSLMEEEISIFKNLTFPSKGFWEDKKTYWNLRLIEAFEVNSVYLTLLSAYSKDFYFREVLKACVKTVFRNKFSLLLPFDINVASTKVSKKIRDCEEDDILKKREFLDKEVKDKLDEAVKTSDELIKNNFIYGKIYNKRSKKNIALRVLRIINQFENKDNSIDWSSFTTEHVFSRTNSSPQEFKDQVLKVEEDYKVKYEKEFRYNENSIYNLTLLPKEDNSEISHDNFENKIEVYKKYDKLPTNKKLIELYEKYKTFNLELVEEYQQFLWEKVKKIFYLDETTSSVPSTDEQPQSQVQPENDSQA